LAGPTGDEWICRGFAGCIDLPGIAM